MAIKIANSLINKGTSYRYRSDGNPMKGAMKDVYFGEDKSYVVALYREPLNENQKERLKLIVTRYKDDFFNREGGVYWKKLYCWPYDMVEAENMTGIVVPSYDSRFFFKKGYANFDILKGNEKDGKWFASAKFRVDNSKTKLDASELGSWLDYFQICVNISRGVKRLHAAGLAHSDLSYKNILIDPSSGSANIIDIDGLVVPGKFHPDVIGTPDFIAPEVLKTKSLPLDDPNRKLPNRLTDLHALAVLIYMYLLYRHPLRGGNYFGDLSEIEEDNLVMGAKALFVEHPTDDSNRNFKREYGDNLDKFQPWTDLKKTHYSITGPYLKDLFDQAFIKGLHSPMDRPPAAIWEQALLRTTDLKLKCDNSACHQKWFIYINSKKTICPFCRTKYKGSIPVLDFYYQAKVGVWKPDNLRLVVYHNSTLHSWHVNRRVARNEKLTIQQKQRVGYFSFFNEKWVFVNETLRRLKDLSNDKEIPVGQMVELINGTKLLLDSEEGGRIVHVQLANES